MTVAGESEGLGAGMVMGGLLDMGSEECSSYSASGERLPGDAKVKKNYRAIESHLRKGTPSYNLLVDCLGILRFRAIVYMKNTGN